MQPFSLDLTIKRLLLLFVAKDKALRKSAGCEGTYEYTDMSDHVKSTMTSSLWSYLSLFVYKICGEDGS